MELGEIETALTAHPHVHQTIAVTRERGSDRLDRQIVAYVAARPTPGLVSELRALACAKLPAYMVPSIIVRMDEFP